MSDWQGCEAHRKFQCHNKPWRRVDVSWGGRWLASYNFCRKHYAQLVRDGATQS